MDIQKQHEDFCRVFKPDFGTIFNVDSIQFEPLEDKYYQDAQRLNWAFAGWLQAAKAQAVPDLGELQERIAGHQYYHDEHGHMIVDMDDVVKEISGFDSWKAQAVPEWISMEDKYPKAGESVLICINGIRQNIAYFYDYSTSDEYSTGHDWFEPVFTGGETEDECVVKTEDVTHWMLLPQEPAND